MLALLGRGVRGTLAALLLPLCIVPVFWIGWSRVQSEHDAYDLHFVRRDIAGVVRAQHLPTSTSKQVEAAVVTADPGAGTPTPQRIDALHRALAHQLTLLHRPVPGRN